MAAESDAHAVVRAAAASLAAQLRRQAELGARGLGASEAAGVSSRLDAIEAALRGAQMAAVRPPSSPPAAAASPAPSTALSSAPQRREPAPVVPVARVAPTEAPSNAPQSPSETNAPQFPWIPAAPSATVPVAKAVVEIASLPAVADRVAALAAVRADLGDCRRCGLCNDRTQIVFGTGTAETRLMFVGEAPGRDEDLQGEPFVGAAGQLLTRMIEAMSLSREQVYIANVIKCRPPKNRDPEASEIARCLPFLVAQIEAIRPEVIVTLGRHSFHALSGTTAGIVASRGKFFDYRGVPVMPTFHPAYVLRQEGDALRETRKQVWEDLQAVMKRLGLEPPKRSA